MTKRTPTRAAVIVCVAGLFAGCASPPDVPDGVYRVTRHSLNTDSCASEGSDDNPVSGSFRVQHNGEEEIAFHSCTSTECGPSEVSERAILHANDDNEWVSDSVHGQALESATTCTIYGHTGRLSINGGAVRVELKSIEGRAEQSCSSLPSLVEAAACTELEIFEGQL
jgi:hypothetical protein